jgi:hypothetical protein
MSTPQAGASSTYGAATATKLTYDPLVSVTLAENEINLVDAYAYGHRVVVNVDKEALNSACTWSRAQGALAPEGAIDASGFKDALLAGILGGFTDLDGQTNGLNFSSAAMTTALAVDPRLREADASGNQPITANDLVMNYVLNKLYGKSDYSTIDNVFNLEDSHGMLATETLASAIEASLGTAAGVNSAVKMFKDLLSSDPQRFFDASGKQISGLFEKNTDVSGAGNWNITADDVIEIRVEFVFAAPITRRDGADYQIVNNTEPNATKNVPTGEKFYVRLQVKATA